MKNFLRVSVLVLVLSQFSQVYAQFSGCASVNTPSNVVIPCGQTCTTLKATAIGGNQTTSYNVGAIDYAPPFSYNAGTVILSDTDDLWSTPIVLPFKFCFFGQAYNQIVIGSNGAISFNANLANTFNNWNIPGPAPFNNPSDLDNSIMAPWQDLDPTFQGTIYYQIGGVAPCRYLAVSWYRSAMYNDPNSVDSASKNPCDSAFHQTQMVVLYETSNIIDIYIQEKAYCSQWNSGRAIEGIQNAAGSIAYTVPGRNATQWAATNDAYRFTPSGAPNYVVTWLKGNVQIGTGDSIQVCPTVPTDYTAKATITLCNDSTVVSTAPVHVSFQTPTINIDSVHQPSVCHPNDGAVFASFDTTGIVSFGWSPGGANKKSLTNLGPGTYIFTVQNSAGCSKSDTVTLTNPPPFTVNVPNNVVVTCLSSTTNGTLTANPVNGVPGYTYNWSTNAHTKTVTGLSIGSYTVTVTDKNGCTASGTGTVSITSQPLTLNAPQIQNVSACPGGAKGSIIVNVGSGTAPYTYGWSPGGTLHTDTLANVPAGNYNVTVTDATGCTATATYAVGTAPALAIDSGTVTPISCTGGKGAINVNATGGIPAYTYTWTGGLQGNPLTGLAAGGYTVTVTDKGGCSATAYYIIGHSMCTPCPAITTNNNVAIPCGQTCTTLTAMAVSAAQTTSYTVAPIDYAPQFPFDSGTGVLVNIDDFWSDTIELPFTFCFFGQVYNNIIIGSNGVISFNISNANTPNNWLITNPAPFNNPSDITNTIMGPWHDMDPSIQGEIYYQISGTAPCRQFEVSWNNLAMYGDANSINNEFCTAVDSETQQIVLYETTNLIDINIKHKSLICNDLDNVTLYSPDGYWNGGLAIEGIQNAAGNLAYTVPGRNATQWEADNDAYRFTPSGAPNDSITWYKDTTVIGTGPNVTVCPTVPTKYKVQAVYTNCDNSTVTVSDSVYVLPGGSLSVNVDSVHPITCAGNNGAVYASYSSQSSPVDSFGWKPGGAGQTSLTNLGPGTYIFSVTTKSGCTKSDTVTLTIPPAISVTVPNDTVFSCNGGNNNTGPLTANVSGGTAPFKYHWNNSDSTASTTVGAGTYSVTVTDKLGCTASASGALSVAVSPPIVFHPPVITNVTCNGGNDGSIALVVTGGVAPINYQWTNPLPNNDTVTGLSAGNYNVTATDAHGCTASATYTVTQPTPITYTKIVQKAICITGGSITVTPSGGVPGYTYIWSSGQTTPTITGIPAGDYTVTITDSKGCKLVATITDSAATPIIVLNNPVVVEPKCTGQSNGSLTAQGTGGTGTLHYHWAFNNDTTITITGLSQGNYAVTVTDSLGCSTSATYQITDPTLVTFGNPTIVKITCVGANNGSITASASGGTGAIKYRWNLNNDSTATITNLGPGTYIVTATDANGCTAVASYTLTQPPPIVINDTTITGAGCTVGGSIRVFASGGTGQLSYHWTNTSQTGDSIYNLPIGTYTVTISDQNQCSISATFAIVPSGNFMSIDSAHITNLVCFDGINGSIKVFAHHGIQGPIVLHWSNNGNTDSIGGLTAGNYSVTASDAGGCTASASYTVTQPTRIVDSVDLQTPYICFGKSNGTAFVSATGGTPGYTYRWSNAVTSQLDTTLPSGAFSVTVTDANHCSASASGTIIQDELVSAKDSVTPFPCGRPPYGNVEIVPNAGISPFSYHIPGVGTNSTGEFGQVLPGSYNFSVTDNVGCTVSGSFIVPEGYAVDSFTISADSASCFGFRDGSILVTPFISNNPPFTYSLNGGSPQITGTFDSLGAGEYQVIVRNNVGCYDTLITTTVEQPDPLLITFNPDTVTIINHDSTTLLPILISHFVSPVYYWTPSDGLSCNNCAEPTVSVTAPTVFYLYVSDSSNINCKAYDSIVVLIKGQFKMPNAFTPNGDSKNDLFGPVYHSYATIKVFHIYNRWGQLIHNSTDPWDGTFDGKEQPAGTYVYYILVEYPDPLNPAVNKTEKQEGSVVLLR